MNQYSPVNASLAHEPEVLPQIIVQRLRELALGETHVEIRHPKNTSAVLVTVTLEKAANLNALFATEQFLKPLILKSMKASNTDFYWRYKPRIKRSESSEFSSLERE